MHDAGGVQSKGVKMSRAIRVLIVLACMAVVVGVGLRGAAWADKLKAGGEAPAASVLAAGTVPADRPDGTVPTTPVCVQTLVPGKFTIGSVAEWALDNVAAGQLYEACVAKQGDLPANPPGVLLTFPIKLTVQSSLTVGVKQRFCFPLPPGLDGYAFYWDGQVWVQTESSKDGQACVDIAPETPAPTFIGLAQKP